MSNHSVKTVTTTPFKDQKPGTSGLRKKTKVFQQTHYLNNFVQATFNVLKCLSSETCAMPRVLVIGGDGRYFGKEAAQTIIKMAAANGVERVWVGANALLSTPAVSAIIRTRESGFVAHGAFILTASHNPGGVDEDFGIKYNGNNGGPAPEQVTNLIFSETCKLSEYKVCDTIPDIDLSKAGHSETFFIGGGASFKVEVIDPVADYVALMKKVFDFDALRKFFAEGKGKTSDFKMMIDAMNGVAGPYATAIFREELQLTDAQLELRNTTPLEDFGKGHPDPNLTYAHDLVKEMGLQRDGTASGDGSKCAYQFGAAFDGDADRNMILGKQFFVTPSDSVAVIAANCECIPFFRGGLKAVARSMPTSAALDAVAKARGITLAEVPTGWKYFGNLMDAKTIFKTEQDYNPMICGEESFGTGSNHVREKDGVWAVLAWLSIIAHKNQGKEGQLVTVEDIVTDHWSTFGRNYYCRYDYEGVDSAAAAKVMDCIRNLKPEDVPALDGAACDKIDDFEYNDPVDKSVSSHQGLRVLFKDQSRFVLRLSGTGSSGATIRLYMEKYITPEEVKKLIGGGSSKKPMPATGEMLKSLVQLSVNTARIAELTGRKEPTVIT